MCWCLDVFQLQEWRIWSVFQPAWPLKHRSNSPFGRSKNLDPTGFHFCLFRTTRRVVGVIWSGLAWLLCLNCVFIQPNFFLKLWAIFSSYAYETEIYFHHKRRCCFFYFISGAVCALTFWFWSFCLKKQKQKSELKSAYVINFALMWLNKQLLIINFLWFLIK